MHLLEEDYCYSAWCAEGAGCEGWLIECLIPLYLGTGPCDMICAYSYDSVCSGLAC